MEYAPLVILSLALAEINQVCAPQFIPIAEQFEDFALPMLHARMASGLAAAWSHAVCLAQVPTTVLYVLGIVVSVARTVHVWQLWSPTTRPKPFRLYGELAHCSAA